VIRRLGGVSLSVFLHAGLIALLLAWSAVDRPRPLFVDLSERAAAPGSPDTVPAPARSTPPAARAAGSRSAPPRPPERPEPVAVEAPSPPPVAPDSPPAERMVSATPPAPVPAAEPAPAAPAAPPADTRSGGGDAGAGGPSGAPTRGDGDRGPGGGPGAPLALATSGGSGAVPAEYGPYLRHFRQRVQESLIYPLAARRRGLGGTVELHVWLEASGRVRDVQVARSSSHDVLDDAAIQTIRRLGPLPFPDSLPRRPLLIRIPLVYELR
jgi:protein TonB